MKNNFYISFIVSARNDNYGGNFLDRLQTTINSLIVQVKRYKLRAELILVEWNPPSDKPLLKDALSWPDDLGPLIVRIIVIPSSIHKRYRCSEKIKMVGAAALNVGIRRAQGEFILSTTADILFSNEFIHFLSLEKLEKNYFYRANRCDVNRNILNMTNSSLEERLDFCKKNIICVYRKGNNSPHDLPQHPILHTNAGDFTLFSKEYWHLLHGWPELNNLGLYSEGLLCYGAYLAGLKEEILEDPIRVYHIDHDSRWKTSTSKSGVYRFLKNKLDYKSKLRRLIKLVIYMGLIPFFQRFGLSAEWEFNIGYLHWGYKKVLRDMLTGRRSWVYNNEMWGLPKEDFVEFIISSAPKSQKNSLHTDQR